MPTIGFEKAGTQASLPVFDVTDTNLPIAPLFVTVNEESQLFLQVFTQQHQT